MTYTEKKRLLLKQIKTREERTEHGIPYKVFDNPPPKLVPTVEDIDKRMWIASDFRSKKAYLDLIQDGSAKLKLKGEKHNTQWVYLNEILLHPSEWRGRI